MPFFSDISIVSGGSVLSDDFKWLGYRLLGVVLRAFAVGRKGCRVFPAGPIALPKLIMGSTV